MTSQRNGRTPIPPKLARLLVARRLSARRDEVLDDLAVSFRQDLEAHGLGYARLRYWWEALNISLLGIGETAERPSTSAAPMIYTHYLKIAVRRTVRQKGYSLINLLGLAVGIACFAIIMLYVQNELSYDQYHADADRIYRVVKDRADLDVSHSYVPPALMPAMLRDIPEVEQAVRVFPYNKGQLSNGNKVFYEERYFYVDSTFFDLFSFSFIRGDAQSAMVAPTSILLTESTAIKYFGNDDPLGKMLTFKTRNLLKEFTVRGVIEDVPAQSHFTFDFLFSMSGFQHRNRVDISWEDEELNAHTYVKLNPDVDIKDVEAKIQDLVEANKPENIYAYATQPLAGLNGIHLASHRSRELQVNSDKLYIKALLIIALFVILIASINYVNLATARSAMRAKEIGVRKVVGALRTSLTRQFLTESVLMAFVAGLAAIALIVVSLPFFNAVMQKQLTLFTQAAQPVWWLIAAVVLLIGLIAGLYPALYLSSFKPISALKSWRVSARRGLGLRQGLVVFQFGLAALLIVGIIVVQEQLDYIQDANLGFDEEHVIIIPNSWQMLNRDPNFVVRNALAELPGVLNAGVGDNLGAIPDRGWFHRMRAQGSDKVIDVIAMEMDHNFLDVFGLELIEGRNFSPLLSTYSDEEIFSDFGVILNETAVRDLGLQNPVVGQQIIYVGSGGSNGDDWRFSIIGVVKDFHFNSLHNEIKPIYYSWGREATTLAVKLAGGDIQETLAQIEAIWAQHAPGAPFEFYFLDTAIDQQYRSEQNFRTLFSAMTALSLLIACLGLFGLTAFTAEQRTKEIGIRKVLGASVTQVVSLLSKDFVKLVLLANLIAWPLAYVAMNTWLDNFAYRMDIGLWTFALAGLSALLIAALTVSYQAIKAAMANPVDSLRYK